VAEHEALTLALRRDYRIRDAEKLVGMTTRQILHAGQMKLKLADWHTGKGNPRRLTMIELFQLRLVSTVDQRVPISALQHLANLGEVYLSGVLISSEQRKKPAIVVGYPDAKGAWWWLLGVDGEWPEDPPPPGSEMLVVIRIREVAARLLKLIVDQLKADLGSSIEPEEFTSSLADDMRHAATVPTRAA
jgi:hypothetical protein